MEIRIQQLIRENDTLRRQNEGLRREIDQRVLNFFWQKGSDRTRSISPIIAKQQSCKRCNQYKAELRQKSIQIQSIREKLKLRLDELLAQLKKKDSMVRVKEAELSHVYSLFSITPDKLKANQLESQAAKFREFQSNKQCEKQMQLQISKLKSQIQVEKQKLITQIEQQKKIKQFKQKIINQKQQQIERLKIGQQQAIQKLEHIQAVVGKLKAQNQNIKGQQKKTREQQQFFNQNQKVLALQREQNQKLNSIINKIREQLQLSQQTVQKLREQNQHIRKMKQDQMSQGKCSSQIQSTTATAQQPTRRRGDKIQHPDQTAAQKMKSELNQLRERESNYKVELANKNNKLLQAQIELQRLSQQNRALKQSLLQAKARLAALQAGFNQSRLLTTEFDYQYPSKEQRMAVSALYQNQGRAADQKVSQSSSGFNLQIRRASSQQHIEMPPSYRHTYRLDPVRLDFAGQRMLSQTPVRMASSPQPQLMGELNSFKNELGQSIRKLMEVTHSAQRMQHNSQHSRREMESESRLRMEQQHQRVFEHLRGEIARFQARESKHRQELRQLKHEHIIKTKLLLVQLDQLRDFRARHSESSLARQDSTISLVKKLELELRQIKQKEEALLEMVANLTQQNKALTGSLKEATRARSNSEVKELICSNKEVSQHIVAVEGGQIAMSHTLEQIKQLLANDVPAQIREQFTGLKETVSSLQLQLALVRSQNQRLRAQSQQQFKCITQTELEVRSLLPLFDLLEDSRESPLRLLRKQIQTTLGQRDLLRGKANKMQSLAHELSKSEEANQKLRLQLQSVRSQTVERKYLTSIEEVIKSTLLEKQQAVTGRQYIEKEVHDQLNAQISLLSAKNIELQQSVLALTKDAAELRIRGEFKQRELNSCESQLKRVSQSLQDQGRMQQEQRDKHRTLVQTKQREIQSLMSQLQQRSALRSQRLLNESVLSEQNLRSLESSKKQLAAKQLEIAQSLNEKKELNAQKIKLLTQVQTDSQLIADLKSRLESAATSQRGLELDLSAQKKRVSQLQQQLSSIQSKKVQAQRRAVQLQNELKNAQSRIGPLQQKILISESKCFQLQLQSNKFQAELSQYKQIASSFETKLQKAKQAADSAQAKQEASRQQISKLQLNLRKLNQQLQILKEDSQRQNNKQFQIKVSKYQKTVQQLQLKTRACELQKERAQSLNRQLSRSVQEKEEVSSQLKRLRLQREQQAHQAASQRAQFTRQTAQLKSEARQQQRKIVQLQRSNSILRDTLAENQKQILAKLKQVETLSRQLSLAQFQKQLAKQQSQKLLLENKRVREQAQSRIKQMNESYHLLLNEKQLTVRHFEEELHKSKINEERLDQQIESLRKQLQTTAVHSQRKCELLLQELQKLKQSIEQRQLLNLVKQKEIGLLKQQNQSLRREQLNLTAQITASQSIQQKVKEENAQANFKYDELLTRQQESKVAQMAAAVQFERMTQNLSNLQQQLRLVNYKNGSLQDEKQQLAERIAILEADNRVLLEKLSLLSQRVEHPIIIVQKQAEVQWVAEELAINQAAIQLNSLQAAIKSEPNMQNEVSLKALPQAQRSRLKQLAEYLQVMKNQMSQLQFLVNSWYSEESKAMTQQSQNWSQLIKQLAVNDRSEEVRSLKQQLQVMNKTVKNKEETLAALKQKQQQLQGKLSSSQKNYEQMLSKLNKYDLELKTARERLAEEQKKSQTLSQENSYLRNEFNKSEKSLSQKQKQCDNYENHMKSSETILEENKKFIGNIEQSCMQAERNLWISTEGDIFRFIQSLANKHAAHPALKDKLAHLPPVIALLRQDLAQLSRQHAQLLKLVRGISVDQAGSEQRDQKVSIHFEVEDVDELSPKKKTTLTLINIAAENRHQETMTRSLKDVSPYELESVGNRTSVVPVDGTFLKQKQVFDIIAAAGLPLTKEEILKRWLNTDKAQHSMDQPNEEQFQPQLTKRVRALASEAVDFAIKVIKAQNVELKGRKRKQTNPEQLQTQIQKLNEKNYIFEKELTEKQNDIEVLLEKQLRMQTQFAAQLNQYQRRETELQEDHKQIEDRLKKLLSEIELKDETIEQLKGSLVEMTSSISEQKQSSHKPHIDTGAQADDHSRSERSEQASFIDQLKRTQEHKEGKNFLPDQESLPDKDIHCDRSNQSLDEVMPHLSRQKIQQDFQHFLEAKLAKEETQMILSLTSQFFRDLPDSALVSHQPPFCLESDEKSLERKLIELTAERNQIAKKLEKLEERHSLELLVRKQHDINLLTVLTPLLSAKYQLSNTDLSELPIEQLTKNLAEEVYSPKAGGLKCESDSRDVQTEGRPEDSWSELFQASRRQEQLQIERQIQEFNSETRKKNEYMGLKYNELCLNFNKIDNRIDRLSKEKLNGILEVIKMNNVYPEFSLRKRPRLDYDLSPKDKERKATRHISKQEEEDSPEYESRKVSSEEAKNSLRMQIQKLRDDLDRSRSKQSQLSRENESLRNRVQQQLERANITNIECNQLRDYIKELERHKENIISPQNQKLILEKTSAIVSMSKGLSECFRLEEPASKAPPSLSMNFVYDRMLQEQKDQAERRRNIEKEMQERTVQLQTCKELGRQLRERVAQLQQLARQQEQELKQFRRKKMGVYVTTGRK